MEINKVRDFTKAWKYDRTMHSFGDIPLFVPITLKTLIVIAIIELIFFVIARWMPFLNSIGLLYYLILPYFMARKILSMNPEGKSLHKFFIGYLKYVLREKKTNRYKPIDGNKKYRFPIPISYRNQRSR